MMGPVSDVKPRGNLGFPLSVPLDVYTKTGDGDVTVDESAIETLRDLIKFLESEESEN